MKNNFAERQRAEDSAATIFSMKTEVRHFFKVILLGNMSVGKTSIFSRLMTGRYEDDYKCTLNVDFRMKSVLIDENTWVEMQVWDTCGQEAYRAVTMQYYNDTQGCVLVYDITDRKSFLDVERWIEDIREIRKDEVAIVLVGNKLDLNDTRAVSFEEGNKLAAKYSIDYLEVSARTGVNIDFLFEVLCKTMIKMSENISLNRKKNKLDRTQVLNKSFAVKASGKNKGCCT